MALEPERVLERVEAPAGSRQPVPRADFTAMPRAGTASLTIQFTDRSTGTIEARLWSFGDGTTATVASPVHTYWVVGLYTVSLTVWGGGISNTLVRPAYIRVGGVQPEATFSGVATDSTDGAFNGQDELLGVAAVGVGVCTSKSGRMTGTSGPNR
ncbi:MAG: PKD domain-containing protein [Anaerolineae bacterium]|nr:PKD domain-containing protein [Anaerolineae bacterium]MDW8067314.1 PKD domain-containing protein [Anaerolineae bacterium]